MTENEEKTNELVEAEAVVPNAAKIAPYEGGFEPTERRAPIEDDGQPYTGHTDLAENGLGVSPIAPRGKEPAPPADD